MDMAQKEWTRKDVLERHRNGKLTGRQAAEILKISERQFRRLQKVYKPSKLDGIRHGNRGKRPSNKTSSRLTAQILALFAGEFVGFNDSHFVECLKEEYDICIGRSTVQRIARAAGLKPARKRKSRRYRGRRQREGQRGKMLLWDGSHHDWLEGRGPKLCMMGAIEDATGELLAGAHFGLQETSAGYLRVLRDVVAENGVPHCIYMDRHGSLRRNDEYWTLAEELQGEQTPTQVGQALRELDINSIFALSPQAKGRVERMWGTLQDRMVSEMRRKKISTLEEANQFLDAYRMRFNQRFAKEAREVAPAWRKKAPGLCIDDVCSFRYEAVVSNDNLVSIDGIKIQIPRPGNGRSYAKARVDVRQHLDGLWRVRYKGLIIAEMRFEGDATEIHPRRTHKHNNGRRAFREAVRTFEAPTEKATKAKGSVKAPLAPFNHWTPKQKAAAAKNSKLLRQQRPANW
jgi:transposase